MTWTPIDSSDFIRKIFLFVLPVAVLLFVLTYRFLSSRLQQIGVPYSHYQVIFFYIAVLSLQIPVFSVVIANGYGSYAEPVAFRAKVINKVARRSKNGIHYVAVLDKPGRASCCTAADGNVSWKEELELSIGSQEYRKISPGRTHMEINVKVGLLGIPYLDSSRLMETETDTSDDRVEDNRHGEDDTSDEGVLKHKHNQVAIQEAERWDPQPPQNGGEKFRTSHWPNGAVRSKEPLLNGKVHGMAIMTWDNGNIYGRIPHRNGLKHGRFELFRRDGSRDQTLSYKNGKLHGKCIWYRTDGSLMAVAVYVDGTLVSNSNYDAR